MSKENAARRQTGITAINIENFKGIGAPVTVPLRPITLLFGANSAGKSTIIQAIHYARELLLRNNPDADIPLAGGNAIDLGGFRNMVHRHETSRIIQIGFEMTLDDDGLPGLDEITGTELTVNPKLVLMGCAYSRDLARDAFRNYWKITNNQAGNVVAEADSGGINIFAENETFAKACGMDVARKNNQGYSILGRI